MKLLYVMDALEGANPGGTERQFLQLLTHLDLDRFDPHLALFRSTSYVERAGAVPCPVEVLNIGRLFDPRAAVRLLRLAAVVRARRVQVVHAFLNDASIAAPIFCRLAGASVIVSRRDMGFWYTKATLAALRISNLFVNGFIANSEAVRRNVQAREGVPAAKIEVLYNGHEPTRFDVAPLPDFRARLGIGPDDPIVGMVANFHPWKRQVDLLRAFALVRQQHPRAHLVLAGAGSTDACRAEAEALGIAPAVHFLGGVKDAVPIVKHFAVGVLCSESEGLSNSVIEYMGCGKPTVCTNVGGNPELVAEGDSGFLINPFDVGALADRIAMLLATPARQESMGARARSIAEGLTSRRMAQHHMNLYERLARVGA